MAQLRLVKTTTPSVFSYKNRMGETYYLHEGKTKTGKPRYYFAKDIREGALSVIPKGFELSESVNAVVSIRRAIAGAFPVPDEDVKLVEAAVGRHPHLRGYVVRAVGSAIVVFEPHPRPEQIRDFAQQLGFPGRTESFVADRMKKAQYAPVMKFELEGDGYAVRRMTYRGEGGWSWPLKDGKLTNLCKSVVAKIGTDGFFELM